MPLARGQTEWLRGVIAGLTALSDNRWMMPTDHLAVILEELAGVIYREVSGAVVEMGCAGGRTSLRLAALLRILGEGPGRPLHLYDSFAGFPPLASVDRPGDVEGTRQNVRYVEGGPARLFAEWGDCLPAPTVHAGFFTEEGDYPDAIAFSLIDCDAHDSMRTALRVVWPRLAPGGAVVVHDYGNPTWPGAKLACDNYFGAGSRAEVGRWEVRCGTVLAITKGRA